MKFLPTKLSGLTVIEPDVFEDQRGYFWETFDEIKFTAAGIDVSFVQDNASFSRAGTLRGLHYQLKPHAQGKLVSCIAGEIFDVAVDIRRDSPTYGQWLGFNLSSANKRALYVPSGFAHGFCALTDATILYQCTDFYAPDFARTIAWNDPDLAIAWPTVPNLNLISEKDKIAPKMKAAEHNF